MNLFYLSFGFSIRPSLVRYKVLDPSVIEVNQLTYIHKREHETNLLVFRSNSTPFDDLQVIVIMHHLASQLRQCAHHTTSDLVL